MYNYVLVRQDRKYRAKHRIVMEEHLGRKLNKTERIIHINGDRKDNRLENLKLVNADTNRLTRDEIEDKMFYSRSKYGSVKSVYYNNTPMFYHVFDKHKTNNNHIFNKKKQEI